MKSADSGILTYVNGAWVEYNKYTDDTLAQNAKDTADAAKSTADSANTTANTAHQEVQNTVNKVDVEYYLSTSATELKGGSWSTTAPAWVDGKYIWSRQKMSYVDSTKEATYGKPACITGGKGATGKTTYFHIKYAPVANPTDAQLTNTPNAYIGTYVDFNATASTSASKYTWSKFQGVDGKDGANGTPGKNGTNGETSYLHIAYANSADGSVDFSTTIATNKKYMGQYVDFELGDSTNPADYKWTLIKGADGETGADGRGIKSTVITYQVSSSGTTAPTGTWTTSIPTVAQGKYLWTKTTITYTDNTTSDSYSVSRAATDGSQGVGIKSVVNKYAVSSSNTTEPTTWYDTPQTMTSTNKYLWNYEILTYTNNTTSETDARVIGVYGDKGNTGSAGKGIKSVKEYYQVSTSNTTAPTTWSETIVSMTASNKYLWNYEVITYTDNTTSETAKRVIGVYGDKGDTGNGVSTVDVYYYLSTSSSELSGGSWSTTAPTWSNGKYMWSKTKTTYTNGSSKESKPVCITGAKGSTGSTGATGTGVDSITEEYYLSTSKTTQSGGSWVTTPPAWVSGKYIWTRSKIVYKNPASTVYTTPVCSSEWEAANAVDNRISDKENHFNFKYYTDVIVYGDTNKFYPVIIKAGDQNVKRTIMVKRGYNERAPKEWNKQTHPGSLTLKILCNFGGLGGVNYSWEIAEFEEMYSHIFGGATLCGYSCMFAIFLRGGGTTGAIYHLYSDQSLTANIYNYGWDSSINKYRANVLPAPQISYRTNYIQYKSDLCFGNPGNKTQNPAGSGYYDDLQYKVDAPKPRAMVANGTTEGGFTKYLRTSSQNEEIRIRNYVKLTQDSDKKLVSSTTTEYYLSTSNLTLTGGSWVTTLPAKISNTYLWTRQKIIYKDGSSIISTATCLDNKSGSRNLLIGTATATGDVASGTGTLVDNLDLFDGLTGVKTNTAWQERYVNLKSVYERNGFRVGDVLTLSVYVKSDSATTKNFGLFRASSNSQNDSSKTINLTSNWQQIYFTFVASDYSKTATTTRIECSSASDTNYIYWAGWKLEKGNIASDWTPAPEDINESIGDVSDIANKANLAAGEAKSDAKNALDQSGEAARKADGALENVKQVENKASEMKVKATTFEYYIVKYEYKEEKKGNIFKSNLIYYSKNNNQYTKVRPNLDKTNHLTDTYYIKDDSSIQKPSSNLSESVVYKNKPQ